MGGESRGREQGGAGVQRASWGVPRCLGAIVAQVPDAAGSISFHIFTARETGSFEKELRPPRHSGASEMMGVKRRQ